MIDDIDGKESREDTDHLMDDLSLSEIKVENSEIRHDATSVEEQRELRVNRFTDKVKDAENSNNILDDEALLISLQQENHLCDDEEMLPIAADSVQQSNRDDQDSRGSGS